MNKRHDTVYVLVKLTYKKRKGIKAADVASALADGIYQASLGEEMLSEVSDMGVEYTDLDVLAPNVQDS